ncbi:hypothetical protein VNO77_34248 [Canavalia gladiata]|uniref:Serine hydroxymethyltransferase-like domain-containing protein n=1 Tax=Canavalia gladiata TaxID=3824 RepID=A0AAN9PYD6_CANGL
MALDLTHGEHLSHGYQTDTKKISAVSIFFKTKPYRSSESIGYIDCYQLEESAYAHLYNSARIRKVCDEQKVVSLADVARLEGRQAMVPNMHAQKNPHMKPSLAPSSKTALVRSMISGTKFCNIWREAREGRAKVLFMQTHHPIFVSISHPCTWDVSRKWPCKRVDSHK